MQRGVDKVLPGARNARYLSSSPLLDANRPSPRFIPYTSIERWRESMRRDALMRAALLNPVRYERRHH
jgi:hypothetical protein